MVKRDQQTAGCSSNENRLHASRARQYRVEHDGGMLVCHVRREFVKEIRDSWLTEERSADSEALLYSIYPLFTSPCFFLGQFNF